jgi:hypothetical protein
MFVSIIYDVAYVSKERDNLWYTTTQPLDCDRVAAKDDLKVSHIIVYNTQPTHFSVSSYLSAYSVPADTGASIGSQGFHQARRRVRQHHHWDARSEKEERRPILIQRDQLQYELEPWKQMWKDFGERILTICPRPCLSPR